MLWFVAIHFFHCVAILGWGTPFCSVVVMLMRLFLAYFLIPFQVVFQSIYFKVYVLRSVLGFSSFCSEKPLVLVGHVQQLQGLLGAVQLFPLFPASLRLVP